MAPMRLAPLALLLAAAGCSSASIPVPVACADGKEPFRGACVEPWARYEPADRLDHDNVSAYGDPLTRLQLPDSPKSGFRLIAPPRTMGPGEEVDYCLSWPIPAVTRHVVYSSRLYTTSGLHHSNVIAKPIDPKFGPNPYPGCHPGAADPFSQIPDAIPDVLFANSTQVVGEETLTFPEAMGFKLDLSREVSTGIHLLNSGSEAEIVEVAYDFYTMDEAELENEVAPFFMQVNDFLIPPHVTKTIESSCKVFGGNVVTLMPHTHKFAKSFVVDLVPNQGEQERVLDDGAFDLGSDIQRYVPPLDLTDVDQMHYGCTFDNTTDHDIVYGLGENEMCILFGYLYPPEKQMVGVAEYEDQPCKAFQIGLFR